MSYVKLSYVEFEFYSFTRYTDGMFQSKFPFKDNKVLSCFEKNITKQLNQKQLSISFFTV